MYTMYSNLSNQFPWFEVVPLSYTLKMLIQLKIIVASTKPNKAHAGYARVDVFYSCVKTPIASTVLHNHSRP